MEDYTGFKEISWEDENASEVFSSPCRNVFGCMMNEYLLLRGGDEDSPMILRCDGDTMSVVKSGAVIKSSWCGEIKPRNEYQKMAIDMLHRPETTIKVLGGLYGAGKLFAPLHGNVQMNIL